jgi:ADP-ribose pyrophosphatase YjhB (NUDIX family)
MAQNFKQCAGFILTRISNKGLEFLLVNDSFNNNRHWTPPKGEIIEGEDEETCAVRELKEILSLQNVRDYVIEPGFAIQIKYLSGVK